MPLVAPTIYLPADRRWEMLGKALGNTLGNGLNAYNMQDALQKSQGMDPEQKAEYLAGRLGPQGMDFVKQLTQLKTAEAQTARANAETANAVTVNQLNQKKLSTFDQQQALENKLKMAEVDASRASAAGSYARAQAAQAEVAIAGQRLKMDQAKNLLTDQLTLLRMDQMKKDQDFEQRLTDQILGGSGGGAAAPSTGGSGVLTPQKQSFTPGEGQPSATVQPIASATSVVDQAPGSASDETQSGGGKAGAPTTSQQLDLINQVDAGVDPAAGQGIPKVELTPDQKLEMLAYIKKHDLAGAMDYKNKLSQPQHIMNKEIAPGIYVNVGLYGDGKTRPIPGTIEDKRKPATPTLVEEANGATLWFQTSKLLQSLSNADPDQKGGDALGGASVRRLNSILQAHGLEPLGGAETRSVREAYQTIYDHNILAINSLMKGMRPAQATINMMKQTAPAPTDTKEIRDQKIKATQITAAVIIKNEVESAVDGGVKVPPTLLQVYKQLGLDKMDLDELQKNYLDTFKSIGVKPVDPTFLGKSDETPSEPASTSGAPPAKEGGLPPGWSVEVK